MDPLLCRICFPDIIDKVALYLDARDIAAFALTNMRFAQYTKETGLLYRHVSLADKLGPKVRKRPPMDDSSPQFYDGLKLCPVNAASVTSLSIRHRFSGYQPSEEISYIERTTSICALCPT